MMCRHYRCLLLAGRLGSEICCRNETTPRALSWDMVFDSSRAGPVLHWDRSHSPTQMGALL